MFLHFGFFEFDPCASTRVVRGSLNSPSSPRRETASPWTHFDCILSHIFRRISVTEVGMSKASGFLIPWPLRYYRMLILSVQIQPVVSSRLFDTISPDSVCGIVTFIHYHNSAVAGSAVKPTCTHDLQHLHSRRTERVFLTGSWQFAIVLWRCTPARPLGENWCKTFTAWGLH